MKHIVFLFSTVLLFSCSKSSEPDLVEISTTEITLKSGELFQIEAKSDSKITYSSEDEYVVYTLEEGVILANHIGETIVNLVNEGGDKKQVTVTVEAKYNTFTEPDQDFGMTTEEIIAKYGEPLYYNEQGIMYENTGLNIVNKVFFLKDDKVDVIGVFLPETLYTETEGFLDERYEYNETQDFYMDALELSDAERLTTIGVGVNNYTAVAYHLKSLVGLRTKAEVNALLESIELPLNW